MNMKIFEYMNIYIYIYAYIYIYISSVHAETVKGDG